MRLGETASVRAYACCAHARNFICTSALGDERIPCRIRVGEREGGEERKNLYDDDVCVYIHTRTYMYAACVLVRKGEKDGERVR